MNQGNMGSHTRSDPSEEQILAMAEQSFANRGCCCFWAPWSGSMSWERIAQAADRAEEPTPTAGRWWWTTGLKALAKVREWSEILAGPRWKTFLRRIGRHNRRGSSGGWQPGSRFGYDPVSYSLNFDDGMDTETDDDVVHRVFSARYAAPPSSTKSSMDLGRRVAPPLLAEPAQPNEV